MDQLTKSLKLKPELDRSQIDKDLAYLQEKFFTINPFKLAKGDQKMARALADVKQKLEYFIGNIDLPWVNDLKNVLHDPELKRALDWANTAKMLKRSGSNVAIDAAKELVPGLSAIAPGGILGAAVKKGAIPGALAGMAIDSSIGIAKIVSKNNAARYKDAPPTFKWIYDLLNTEANKRPKMLFDYMQGKASWQLTTKAFNPLEYQEEQARLRAVYMSDDYRRMAALPQYAPDNDGSSTIDYSLNISDLEGLNEQFQELSETSGDTFSTITNNALLVKNQGMEPLYQNLLYTNDMLATELPLSSRASFTGMASGLMGVNTNFGLVQASSMGAFQQIDQGLSNNTDAMQLLLNQGIEPAALGFGTLLPEQLGLFQDAHATTFTTAGDPARPY